MIRVSLYDLSLTITELIINRFLKNTPDLWKAFLYNSTQLSDQVADIFFNLFLFIIF